MKRTLFTLSCVLAWARGQPLPWLTRRVPEVPESPAPRVVYLVGEGEHCWFAAFQCPCRCGALVQLSTLSEDRPRWAVEEHWNGAVTLRPSINRTRGCHSHFFVRRGRVVWAEEFGG